MGVKNVMKMVLGIVMLLVTIAQAQTLPPLFTCNIWHESATNYTLQFGMGEDAVNPYPPKGPGDIKSVFFLGRFMDDMDADQVEAYFKAYQDVKVPAESASWILNVPEGVVKIGFASDDFPAGAILQLDDTEITPENGGKPATYYELKMGKHTLTYQLSAEVPVAPAQPENVKLSMLAVPNASLAQPATADLRIVSQPAGYGADGVLISDNFGSAIIESGADGNATWKYTLPGELQDVTFVRFAIANEKDGVQSAAATVLIKLEKMISATLVTEDYVTLEAGGKDGTDTTDIHFELDVAEGVNETLTFTLRLPVWKNLEADPFPYEATVFGYEDNTFAKGTEITKNSVPQKPYEFTFDLPVNGRQTYYLGVTLKAGKDAESRRLELVAAAGGQTVLNLPAPYIYIKGSGTLDFDGNGVIDDNDAIMFYNFTSLGGVELPEDFAGDGYMSLSEGLDVTTEGAMIARDLFVQKPQFLDFDGNNKIDDNDAIMFYNFTSLGGVELPDDFAGDGYMSLSEGLDVTPEGAMRARDFFINTSKK